MPQSKDFPYPPFDLATRVLELPSDDETGFGFYERFGRETRDELVRLLPAEVWAPGKRVLDFGCGAGRTLRHFLGEAEIAELWGVDVDGPSIDWLQSNLCPPLHAANSPTDPPLDFETGYFDAAWAISIFTHLADNSAAWLLELHRVLKPGGLLMASFMGEWNSEAIAGEAWDEDRIGMNILRHDQPWDQGGPMVLMSEWWMREHWGRAFEIVAINPRFHEQSWALLRKKEVALSPDELLAPGADPREWTALRHNSVQNRRDSQAQVAALESRLAAADDRQAQVESSLSWKLTRPLRRIAGRARGPRA